MAPTETAEEKPPETRSKGRVLIGLLLVGLIGAGGFFAMYSGVLQKFVGEKSSAGAGMKKAAAESQGAAFVPLEPLIISLGPAASNRHLRFSATLEVAAAEQGRVTELTPRVLDVLNGYLRAVNVADLEDPTALIRLRAQMLRRVQIVTGEGRVRDLLVTEFVLN